MIPIFINTDTVLAMSLRLDVLIVAVKHSVPTRREGRNPFAPQRQ